MKVVEVPVSNFCQRTLEHFVSPFDSLQVREGERNFKTMEGQIKNGRRPAKVSKSSGLTKAQKTDDSIMGVSFYTGKTPSSVDVNEN